MQIEEKEVRKRNIRRIRISESAEQKIKENANGYDNYLENDDRMRGVN